jgi:hypothetical protein
MKFMFMSTKCYMCTSLIAVYKSAPSHIHVTRKSILDVGVLTTSIFRVVFSCSKVPALGGYKLANNRCEIRMLVQSE